MLTGPDVSHWQGVVDWAQVRMAGHDFAWCKATEGRTFIDPRFAQNWVGIRNASLVRGAYHFLRSDSDPSAQARHFVQTVVARSDQGSLIGSMMAVDVESGTNDSHPNLIHVRRFADEFNTITDHHPLVVYTGAWYWRDRIGNPDGAFIGPLWHSRYSDNPGLSYGGWQEFTFWQHTSKGHCPGVQGNCDLNRFYGELADLRRLTRPLSVPDIIAKGKTGMLLLIKGANKPEWWLTDGMTKRHIATVEDIAIIVWIWTAAGKGDLIQHKNLQPHVLGADQQDFIDRIPVVQ